MVNFNGVNGAKGLPFGEGSRSDGIKKQETSQPSIFDETTYHEYDKNQDNELSAVEMGIDEALKTLQDKLPKTSTTTEGGQRLSLLRKIIDQLGKNFKYDGKISDASEEMDKRQNDVARILDAIKRNNINDNTIEALESDAAMATIYENVKVYEELDKVKGEVEKIITELKDPICAAAKKAIDTNQDIDYSTIPVERQPKGFELKLEKGEFKKAISKQKEGVKNDVRSKNGEEIHRYTDGGILTIEYTLIHKGTKETFTGEYKFKLEKDFFGKNDFAKNDKQKLTVGVSKDIEEFEE